jgi:hypothetical protein
MPLSSQSLTAIAVGEVAALAELIADGGGALVGPSNIQRWCRACSAGGVLGRCGGAGPLVARVAAARRTMGRADGLHGQGGAAGRAVAWVRRAADRRTRGGVRGRGTR